tara:strand:- start:3 stop:1304 length:1302 start_codon:yes stop_codon:yes gene_type:complete
MGINSCGTTLIDNGAFKNIGAVSWDTTAKTSNFTGVAGNGYFVNTTSGSITVTLPSSPSAGDAIGIADYANTADTNKIVINPNGNKIQGSTDNFDLVNEGGSIVLVYVDATQGWLSVDSAVASDIVNPFIQATGGTVTTSGDFKIHTFTSPGTFCVSGAGSPAGSDTVDYMVVAGGGSGGGHAPGTSASFAGGGGGAGGFRESHSTPVSGCYTASPLATPTGIPVSVQGYPITVGAGGATNTTSSPNSGNPGSNSVFSTITSTGGGGGALGNSAPGGDGGSGGGHSAYTSGGSSAGSGNTPPVSPPQGNNGGTQGAFPNRGSSGGGGATAAGGNNPSGNDGSSGGAGATTNITASPVARSGGGGGGGWNNAANGSGGTGGGGNGGKLSNGVAGTVNTGGGGGGSGPQNVVGGGGINEGGAGGSGIVVIRYKFQ